MSRRIPVHRSLHRRILVLGAERDMVEGLGFISLLLAFGGGSKASVGLAVLIWFVGLYALRKMAKADPYMSEIFTKHVKHQSFYAARSSLWRLS
jgi:type IV secretory pathway TrbD component